MIDDHAYVSIYVSGAPHSEYGYWERPGSAESVLFFYAPDTPGAYEMRLYKRDYYYLDEDLVVSVPFVVY
jgi:hypothetical protein